MAMHFLASAAILDMIDIDMPQCLVINATHSHEWFDRHFRHVIPHNTRPGFIHPTRESAEREAARLAGETGGKFAVFELVGICSGDTLSDSDRVRGVGPCGARIPRWAPDGVEL